MDTHDRERGSGALLLLVRCQHTGAAQAVPRSNRWLTLRGQVAPQLGSRAVLAFADGGLMWAFTGVYACF